jgi:hypothetical protein
LEKWVVKLLKPRALVSWLILLDTELKGVKKVAVLVRVAAVQKRNMKRSKHVSSTIPLYNTM